MEGIISMIFNILILIFLFFGVFWGFVRGLKKTASRVIFLIFTAIITLFVAPIITNAILNIETTFTLNGETQLMPLKECMVHLVDEMIGSNFSHDFPIINEILVNIPKAIMNVIIFTVLFWVLKIILYPFNYLFYKLTFAPKVKDKKAPKQRMLGALVGLACGLVVTFCTMIPFYGIMDIFSTVNTIKINSGKENEISLSKATDNMTDGIISAYNGSFTNILTQYTGIKGLGLLAFDKLTVQEYGNTSTTLRKEIDNIASMTTLLDDFLNTIDSANKENKTLTKEDVSNIITKLKGIVSATKEIKLIDSLGDIIIPAISGHLEQQNANLTDNENVNKYILAMAKELSTNQNLNLFSEINNILTFIEYINEEDLLVPIINNEFSNASQVFNSIDNNFVNNFNEKLFNIQIVDTCIPHVINIALSFVTDALEIEMDETSATSENIKTDLNNIITKVINFGKTIDDTSSSLISTNSIIPLGEMIDAIKDSHIITDTTYINVLNYTSDKLQELSSDIVPEDMQNFFNNGLLKNLHNVESWTSDLTQINNALNILRDKENGILGEVQESEELRQGFNLDFQVEKDKFINLGKALDILEITKLLGNKVNTNIDNTTYNISPIKMLFIDILNIANDTIEENDMQEFENVVSDMKKNILNNNQTNVKFWQEEMEYTSPLIEEIYTMIDTNNVDITDTLGTNLDLARKSVMLGGTTTINLVSTALDMAKDNILGSNFEYENNQDLQTTDDKIYELFTSIDEELHSNLIKNTLTPGQATYNKNFWKEEFKCYNKLKDISEEASEISDTSSAVEIADELDYIFANSKSIKKSKLSSIVACSIDQIRTNETEGVKGEINKLLSKISANLKDENFFNSKDTTDFWTIELNYMNDLYNMEFSGDDIVEELNTIGQELDIVAIKGKVVDTGVANDPTTPEDESKKTYHPSYLIEEIDIRNILSKSIDEMKENILSSFIDNTINKTIDTALTKISINLFDTINIPTISFENELSHLQTLANMDINPDAFEVVEILDTDSPDVKAEKEQLIEKNSKSLVAIGTSLDSIGHNLITENNLIKYAPNNNYSTYNYSNSRVITREILSDLIIGVFDVAKNSADAQIQENMDDVANENKTQVAFDNTIIRIENQISSITSSNKVFSWARELSYITTLTNLNAGETYTIDNAGAKLSDNLDIIAFNLKSDGVTYLDILHNAEGYITSMPEGENTNSMFITRDILKASVKDLSTTISIEDIDEHCKEIVNDLINNLSIKVAGDNSVVNITTNYPTFNSAFDDLTAVKNEITSKFDTFNDGLTLADISTTTASDYDKLLQNLQSKLICHNITTRKVAILLFDELYNTMVNLDANSLLPEEFKFQNTDAGNYIENLLAHYNSVNESSNAKLTAEMYYNTSTDTSSTNIATDFDNPFTRLINIYNIPTV